MQYTGLEQRKKSITEVGNRFRIIRKVQDKKLWFFKKQELISRKRKRINIHKNNEKEKESKGEWKYRKEQEERKKWGEKRNLNLR